MKSYLKFNIFVGLVLDALTFQPTSGMAYYIKKIKNAAFQKYIKPGADVSGYLTIYC